MSKFLKLYAYIFGVIAYIAIMVGLVAPSLVSSNDTLNVVLGFVLLALSVPVLVYAGKKILEEINNV